MIYLVEDDENIRELVCYTLTNLVRPTIGFADGVEFEKAFAAEVPELVIFDLMLPGKDGLTLLKELRQNPAHTLLPVLILSAKGTELDKVQGLNLGADDYLAKPFGAMELVARVNALLRRNQAQQRAAEKPVGLTFGPLRYQADQRVFYLAEKPLTLTHKEFSLLKLFVENPKLALSREQLLDAVWGYEYDGESRTVDVHIAALRQKLGNFGTQIETIRSFGYRFNPPAESEQAGGR